jgi:hypothetical protein
MYSTEVYCADGETIARIAWYPHPVDTATGSIGTYREANATRIVECVNALEGIENPAAFREVFGELVEALERIRLRGNQWESALKNWTGALSMSRTSGGCVAAEAEWAAYIATAALAKAKELQS